MGMSPKFGSIEYSIESQRQSTLVQQTATAPAPINSTPAPCFLSFLTTIYLKRWASAPRRVFPTQAIHNPYTIHTQSIHNRLMEPEEAPLFSGGSLRRHGNRKKFKVKKWKNSKITTGCIEMALTGSSGIHQFIGPIKEIKDTGMGGSNPSNGIEMGSKWDRNGIEMGSKWDRNGLESDATSLV